MDHVAASLSIDWIQLRSGRLALQRGQYVGRASAGGGYGLIAT